MLWGFNFIISLSEPTKSEHGQYLDVPVNTIPDKRSRRKPLRVISSLWFLFGFWIGQIERIFRSDIKEELKEEA